jgi:DNA-binding transcriptional LysR family regulator
MPRGLRLTASGAVVAEHVESVMRGLGAMRGALDELRGLERGHVVIASVPAAAAELLPKIVSAIAIKHPQITFSCNFMGSNEIAEAVASGDADVGIAFNPPMQRALRRVSVVKINFGAIMTPDHPLAKRRSLRVSELVAAGTRFIFPDVTHTTRSEIDEVLDRAALDIHPVVTSFNRDFVIGMAMFGGGVAIRTPVGSEREVREGKLVFVPLTEPKLRNRELTLLAHATRRKSLVTALLLDVAVRHFAELRRSIQPRAPARKPSRRP